MKAGEKRATAFTLALIGFVLLLVGFDVGVWLRESQAIERGYALHCPKTGDFAWKGECDG